MGGEWSFRFLGDHSKFDMDLYHQTLFEIRAKYKGRFDADTRYGNARMNFWFQGQDLKIGPPDNIFAKFSYNCTRNTCRRNEILFPSESSGHHGCWFLYWNPLIVDNKNIYTWSDVYTRCAPIPKANGFKFTDMSVEIQKLLATKFPDNFQLYLGDDIGGYGPASDQYFGVKPDGYTGGYDGEEEDY